MPLMERQKAAADRVHFSAGQNDARPMANAQRAGLVGGRILELVERSPKGGARWKNWMTLDYNDTQ